MSHQALTELLRGKGAHADPFACVEDIGADVAERRIEGFPHSIADLVFHMNYWMNYELNRIHRQRPKYPEHNAETFPTTPQDWDQLKSDFARLLSEYAKLANSPAAELNRQVESMHKGDQQQANSVEAILWQMVAHNSYHIGQIAAIRRAQGAWPPKSGGDTW